MWKDVTEETKQREGPQNGTDVITDWVPGEAGSETGQHGQERMPMGWTCRRWNRKQDGTEWEVERQRKHDNRLSRPPFEALQLAWLIGGIGPTWLELYTAFWISHWIWYILGSSVTSRRWLSSWGSPWKGQWTALRAQQHVLPWRQIWLVNPMSPAHTMVTPSFSPLCSPSHVRRKSPRMSGMMLIWYFLIPGGGSAHSHEEG